ncbi:MAG: putative signal transducing protein [Armatimonadota bacterium]
MPFCPVCEYEYIEGIRSCPDCDVDLVDRLDEESAPEKSYIDEDIVQVFRTNNKMEAIIVDDMLKASGIPTILRSGLIPYYEIRAVDSAQELSISVFRSQAEEALKLIEQQDLAQPE